MSKAHLAPCAQCARHVRVSEHACPFCGAATSDAFRAKVAPRPPLQRLSRAALYAFGASSIALTGCETQAIPAYGAPAIPLDGGSRDASNDAAGDAGHDAGPVVDAAYGGPPIDAGNDAEKDAEPVVDAAYGGPPIDAGNDAEKDAEPVVDAAYGGPPIDAGTD